MRVKVREWLGLTMSERMILLIDASKKIKKPRLKSTRQLSIKSIVSPLLNEK